jgi:hypothetical protein
LFVDFRELASLGAENSKDPFAVTCLVVLFIVIRSALNFTLLVSNMALPYKVIVLAAVSVFMKSAWYLQAVSGV